MQDQIAFFRIGIPRFGSGFGEISFIQDRSLGLICGVEKAHHGSILRRIAPEAGRRAVEKTSIHRKKRQKKHHGGQTANEYHTSAAKTGRLPRRPLGFPVSRGLLDLSVAPHTDLYSRSHSLMHAVAVPKGVYWSCCPSISNALLPQRGAAS